MGLKITAFAAPFNKPNAYHETLAPCCFDAWIDRHCIGGTLKTPLPMQTMHKRNAGKWVHVWRDNVGLWCEGLLLRPDAIEKVRNGIYREVSIDYDGTQDGKAITYERALTTVARAYHTHEKFLAELLLEREERDPAGDPVPPLVREQTTHHALLKEISLVDAGAYPGTHFDFTEA